MPSAALTSARAAQRARLIKTIQTGRGKLGLDDDTYRDLLSAKAGGKRSAKDLDIRELEAVLAHMRAAGFKPTKPASTTPRERRTLDSSAEASKVRALWLWLHQVGIVRDSSEAALAAFVRRTNGVDDLRWARRKDWTIEGIKAWAARQLPAKLEERLARLREADAVPPTVTLGALCQAVSPTLHPRTFDALQRAWNYLDQVEGNVAKPQ